MKPNFSYIYISKREKVINECVAKILEMVRKKNSWLNHIDSDYSVCPDTAYDLERGSDAGDWYYFKSPSNHRLVSVWSRLDRNYIYRERRYDYVQLIKEEDAR